MVEYIRACITGFYTNIEADRLIFLKDNSVYIRTALFAGLFLSMVYFAPAAHAQKILNQYKKPLPVVPAMDDAAFQEATTYYKETPFGDEQLAYEISLDKSWKKMTDGGLSNYKLSNRLLGEVARYYGPPGLEARSRFTIHALDLEYQLSAEQWFLQYVLANGFTPMGIKVHNENKVEALYVLLEKDITYVVRAIAHLNGKRMVLAQYFITDQVWNDENSMQAKSIDSFKLTNIKEEIIEKMLAFQFLDVAEFKYPVSWDLRAPPLRSIDRMGIKLINTQKGGSLDGQIEVHLSSTFVAKSLIEEVERFKKGIEEKGLILGELIEKEDGYIFDDNIQFASVEVYGVTDKNGALVNYEFWFTVMASGGYYYFVTLLTPARDDDFFVWSRNTETYRLVVQSVTPLEESLAEE